MTEQQQTAENLQVKLSLTIGEISAVFGVIETGSFQGVMSNVISDIRNQITSKNIPAGRTQADTLAIQVDVGLRLGDVNAIVNILNANTGFISVMRPVIEKITGQAQAQVNAVPPAQDQTQTTQAMMNNFANLVPQSPAPGH